MNRKRTANLWIKKPSPSAPEYGSQSRSHVQMHNVIYGMHAVQAALNNPKRIIDAGYFTENARLKLENLLTARNVDITILKPAEIDDMLESDAVHQGVLLHVQPLDHPDLESFLDEVEGNQCISIAMLDQVTDPHNVGAILRSAAAFKIDALIVQDRHSAALTSSLAKVASGGLEHVPIIETVNLSRALESLKDRNYCCIGFDSQANGFFKSSDVQGLDRIVMVLGAEDRGLRRLVREHCDHVRALTVPGPVKSLNVSNAAAIVFYEVAKQFNDMKQEK